MKLRYGFAVNDQVQRSSRYIYDIEIDPQHRRHGHAYRALLALEEEARRLELAGVALHVFRHNITAQALYASTNRVSHGGRWGRAVPVLQPPRTKSLIE